jgi:single-strand DNA-binding protein
MASFNKVMLMGNLTRDPELRYIPSGSAVTSFTVAMNRVYKLQTGEKKEETSFVKVVVWGRMAEICGEYLTKGSPVFVEGRLQSRSWDGPNGEKRSALEVIAQSVQFLGRSGGSKGGQAPPPDAEASALGGKEEIPDIQLDEMPEMGAKGGESDTPF